MSRHVAAPTSAQLPASGDPGTSPVLATGRVAAGVRPYPGPVKPTDIRDLVHFSPDGVRRHELFETDHLWSEVVCLQDNQRLGPIGDDRSDGLVVVLAGRVAVQVGKGRSRMGQWQSVTVPAGDELTIANASDEASVVLVVTAPPPDEAP